MDIDNYKEIKLAELEKENTKNKNIINDLLIANKKLIQKNEELKEKNKKYSKINEQDTKDFAKYSNALDEIEKIVNIDYYQDSWGTLAIKIDRIKEIINRTKEENQCEQ